jgi:hypothetical protein
MPSRSRTPNRCALVAAATLVGVTALAPAGIARADEVASTPKGTVGGALLGAEFVTIVESLVGVRPGWAYAVGAIVGAGGGGVGGYFVDQNSTDGKAPMYLLAGGLAFVIPAVVLTLNATRYRPEEGANEDNVPTGPAAEPGVPGGSVGGTPVQPASPPPTSAPPPPSGPQSLLDMGGGSVQLAIPVPDVRPVFSASEQRQYGVRASGAELRMPVLRVAF